METIEIVPFDVAHVEGAVALSRQAGWPHRAEDWDLVRSLSAGWAASADGRVVGTALITPFGPDFAAANMIIVDETMRGRGLGRRLMDALLAAREGRTLQLVATEAGRPLYEKLGFVAVGEVAQHQGQAGPVATPGGVTEAGPRDLDVIAALDRAATGADRRDLLARLSAAGAAAVLRHGGDLRGYALVRAFGRGEVIGPVVASSVDEARVLVGHVLARREGAFMRVDVPVGAGLEDWLTSAGLPRVGGGLVMRLGAAPHRTDGGPAIHALASQALG